LERSGELLFSLWPTQVAARIPHQPINRVEPYIEAEQTPYLYVCRNYSCTLQLVKHRAKMSPWWGIYRQSHDCTNEQSN